MYDCIILAGGLGKRLSPLTNGFPKPLVGVGNKPVLEHILSKLEKAGTKRCMLTLMYEGEQIKKRFGKSYKGMKLEYFTETEPLGTAGGAKRAINTVSDDDSVIVMSGDGMTDVDIDALVTFHETHRADVTIGTYFSEDPTEYGTVVTDPDGRVKRFIEKASWSRTVTGCVNTGIYVIRKSMFEFVPENEPFDFATDLFPKLMAEGKDVFAARMKGFWCDIGNLPSLLYANLSALGGKIDSDFEYFPFSGEGVATGNNMFANNVSIAIGSAVDGCVMGSGSSVGKYGLVKDSLVYDGAKIGDRCFLNSCIVSYNAEVPSGTVASNIIFSSEAAGDIASEISFEFTDDGILYTGSDEETDFINFGNAVMNAAANGKIGIACDDSDSSERLSRLIAEGASKAGGKCIFDFGKSWASQSAFAAYSFALGVCIFVENTDGKTKIKLFDSSTKPVCTDFERRLKTNLKSKEKGSENTEIVRTYGLMPRYTDALVKSVYSGNLSVFSLAEMKISVNACPALSAIRNALLLMDAEVYTEEKAHRYFDSDGTPYLAVNISDDGFDMKITAEGALYSRSEICAILAADSAYRGEFDLPSSYERCPEFEWADERLRVEKYASTPSDRFEALARFNTRRNLWQDDAAFMLIRLLAVLKSRNTTLAKLSAASRQVWRREEIVPLDIGKVYVMDVLMKDGAEDGGEGIVIRKGDKLANIRCNRAESLRIISYASSSEAASDLCAEVKRKIEEIKKFQ